jgi:hypothetical protein
MLKRDVAARRPLAVPASRPRDRRLSVKAGLRAYEIARLDWSMVLDATGSVGDNLFYPERDREATLRAPHSHPHRSEVLVARLLSISDPSGPVIRSARSGHMRPNSIVNWFVKMFATLHYEAARRIQFDAPLSPRPPGTSIAWAAACATSRCSPGHRSVQTTQGYFDGDTPGQRRLVGML